jgi:hypothetical protein
MTYEEAEELAALIGGWGAGGSDLTLTCAQDVFGELQEVPLSAEPEILVIPHYEPGQWKLVRHDSCDVIGGETIDQALIVSHENCTVLGENR